MKPTFAAMKRMLSGLAVLLILSGCLQNKIKQQPEWKSYIPSGAGTMAIWDNGHNNFEIFNMPRYRDSAFNPGNTFHAVLGLAGLQSGISFSDTSLIDGKVSLKDALITGNDSAFLRLSQRIGMDTMRLFMDSLSYGNKAIHAGAYWKDSLRLVGDEQLGLIKRLYFRQLPFQNRNQEIIRDLMRREQSAAYMLHYLVQPDAPGVTGWITGWIEENRHVYFFLINREYAAGQPSLPELLKKWLADLGFFQGKK